jgi:hypothetical protein
MTMFDPIRRAVLTALLSAVLAGCDGVAQRKLIAGQHSEHDVRQLMGVPTLVWERPDGGRDWDYVRAPMGIETLRVTLGKDGRYQGMSQLLTESNFRKAQSGMTGDELTRLISKPTETQRMALSKELIWSWRYQGDDGVKRRFNAHFDASGERVARYSRTDDPQQNPN